ncbi:hypothetical protein [Labrenzia sp. PHM005]|uniref:hypothetical protein n=1 Tax=Labrenzia sp. PHM005 TaxID=2590016 RepID=UPI00113FF562|nr:hypothetical protein [Labrenzia sp. PHM005]QDG77838.1 hypothetical protein FJ695_19325 [Labrenzia sp. PHM005]
MQTPPPLQLDKNASSKWSKAMGTPRFTARTGSPPPCRPLVMAARLIIPVFAAAAAWSSLWIGPLFASIFALWTCWAVVAVARLIRARGPAVFRQAAFGERIWLNQLAQVPRTSGIAKFAVLYLTAWTGLIVTILGGLFQSPMLTATGLIVTWAAHAVCIQRLAGFYRMQKNSHPLYRFWETQPANDDRRDAKSDLDQEEPLAGNLPRERQRPSIR